MTSAVKPPSSPHVPATGGHQGAGQRQRYPRSTKPEPVRPGQPQQHGRDCDDEGREEDHDRRAGVGDSTPVARSSCQRLPVRVRGSGAVREIRGIRRGIPDVGGHLGIGRMGRPPHPAARASPQPHPAHLDVGNRCQAAIRRAGPQRASLALTELRTSRRPSKVLATPRSPTPDVRPVPTLRADGPGRRSGPTPPCPIAVGPSGRNRAGSAAAQSSVRRRTRARRMDGVHTKATAARTSGRPTRTAPVRTHGWT